METASARRPLKSRDTGWPKALAGLLLKGRVSPNAISVASVFFAAGAGAALYFSAQAGPRQRMLLLALAAAGIQFAWPRTCSMACHSLIIFPEGTRGRGDEIGPFKSGIYHLWSKRPDVQFVPVYLANLNRVLPKGEVLPVPFISRVAFGPPLAPAVP
jgi:hypothetical protein